MGVRFRKSVKLAPGLRMNFSGSGVSWTVGPRGASLGFGKNGIHLNTGIPGSGFYSRERIHNAGSTGRSTEKVITNVPLTVHIDESGIISFLDASGNPAPESWVIAAKKQQGDAIRSLIQTECDRINAQIEALGQLHHDTPNPRLHPRYQRVSFDNPEPVHPVFIKPGFLAALFKSDRERIERENAEKQCSYEKVLQEWESAKHEFEIREANRKQLIEHGIYSDTIDMATFLAGTLQDIIWPEETDVSFDILEEGKRVFLDVDLPEIEDMPTKTADAPLRGYRLNIKDISPAKIRALYMQHVHGVGFRIIGEAFAALPIAEEVILSGYSQRVDPATAQIHDEYLYSVRVRRADWKMIQFHNLPALDVVEALARFELRRDMSKTAVFKPIEPITA
jgi:hypothetical protein